MNILLVDCDLGPLPSHTVRSVHLPEGGIVSVFRFLGKDGTGAPRFMPDLIVQRETLGNRLFLADLEKLSCPKIYWAIDSHLNLFWQVYYARCFNILLTPHPSLFHSHPLFSLLPRTVSFAFPGYERTCLPFSERTRSLIFVGRIDHERQERAQFAAYLAKKGACITTASFAEMLALYETTRLLPNESIGQEFNFRIMEGASCGCCVLTEDIGSDLEENFEPGREVLTYRHVQELDELLLFCERHPTLAEKIGRAAWERVRSSHLLSHRTATLFREHERAGACPPQAECRTNLVSACAQFTRGSSTCFGQMQPIIRMLETVDPSPGRDMLRVKLLLEEGETDRARDLIESLRAEDICPGCHDRAGERGGSERTGMCEDPVCTDPVYADRFLDYCLLLYGAALFLQDRRYLERLSDTVRVHSGDETGQTEVQAGFHLVDRCLKAGRYLRAGFSFVPLHHVPETAYELLMTLERFSMTDEEHDIWRRLYADCLSQTPARIQTLQACANLSVYSPEDWRISFRLALQHLKVYQLEEGTEELRMARSYARASGEEEAFETCLRKHGLHC